MNSRDPHTLIEKLRSLPPERVMEVKDFVDFLCTRDGTRVGVQAAARVAEPAFAKIWDNEEDAAYDKL